MPGTHFELSDGTLLIDPKPVHPRSLQRQMWIQTADGPAQIIDLRMRAGGGRIVHLAGGRPLSLSERDAALVFTHVPTPAARPGRPD
jgi:hypothetical protein